MKIRTIRRSVVAVALLFTSAACGVSNEGADPDSYPQQTIDVIVPLPAGGASDTIARALVDAVNASGDLPEKLQVINRDGGGGVVGASEVLNAKPDGYTIAIGPEGSITLQPLVEDVSYDPLDMTPIAQVTKGPVAIAVPADSPYQNIDDLIDAAIKKPGSISFGEGPLVYAVALASLERATGVTFKNVDYEGDAASTIALLGGNVDVAMTQSAAILSQVNAGKLRVLAVGGDERSNFLPDTPTLQESGIDVQATGVNGIFGPAGLPDQIVEKLTSAFVTAMETPEFQELAQTAGLDIAIGDGDVLMDYFSAKIDSNKEILDATGGDL